MNDTTPIVDRVREALMQMCIETHRAPPECLRDLDDWRERMRPHAYVLEQFFDTYHGVHTPLWELMRLVQELIGAPDPANMKSSSGGNPGAGPAAPLQAGEVARSDPRASGGGAPPGAPCGSTPPPAAPPRSADGWAYALRNAGEALGKKIGPITPRELHEIREAHFSAAMAQARREGWIEARDMISIYVAGYQERTTPRVIAEHVSLLQPPGGAS